LTATSEIPLANPLPQRYFTDEPGVGGRIKARPEDFLVDELPLYQPEDAGEHLYLGIQKTNVPHAELMSCLRRHFGVTDRDIGFAGMKDKVGVTRQMVSVHLLKDPPTVEIPHKRIQVLWATRHRNKLRLGHLAGNRFSIRIREVDPLKAPQAQRTLNRLAKEGVPNYFGSQRFGYRCNNHVMGAALLAGDWSGLLSNLLGTAGGSFPEYQRQRRELFDAGKFEQAAAMWTTADRSERIAGTARANGRKSKDACLKIGENALSFWVSALQSAVFNRVLDWRIEQGLFNQFIEGDLAFKHDSRGVFNVTAEELAKPELAQRLAAMEVSPSGPLWGRGLMTPAPGSMPAEMEKRALTVLGVTEELLTASKRSSEGARRPLRTILKNPEIDAGLDEHGQFIRVAFDLPRGAYATVVLREIMKNDVVDDADAEE
jgi:tRNA pseudouridine13 synthase